MASNLVISSVLGRDVQLMHKLGRTLVLYGSRGPWPLFAMSLESIDCLSLLLYNMPVGFQVHSEFIKDLTDLAVSSLAWSISSTSSGAVFVLFGSCGVQFPSRIADLCALSHAISRSCQGP
eukprot:m51a1_g8289 hypothetical protein (121) ;mRNA; r:131860-132271